jgi:hypothetical protein
VHDGLGIIAVHVENGSIYGFGHVRGIRRCGVGTRTPQCRSEAHLNSKCHRHHRRQFIHVPSWG